MRLPSLRFLAPFAVCLVACAGTQFGYGASQVGIDDPSRPLTIEHESCATEGSGAVSVDSDHDGKPEVVHVMEGGREVCRAIHVDKDGKPDSFVYFEPNGTVRRHEGSTTGDGKIDTVSTFRNGALSSTVTDSDRNGKPDTWEYYEDGKLRKRLRDANGNGKVDEWWTWIGKNGGCADVHHDHDEDGKVDLKTEICHAAASSSGAVPPPPPR